MFRESKLKGKEKAVEYLYYDYYDWDSRKVSGYLSDEYDDDNSLVDIFNDSLEDISLRNSEDDSFNDKLNVISEDFNEIINETKEIRFNNWWFWILVLFSSSFFFIFLKRRSRK